MLRAQPLGPYWGRGTYVAGTAPEVASHAFGRARNLCCAHSPWGKSEGSPEVAQAGCGRKIGGAPGMRAGRLGTQHGRGPWNARREAQAIT